MLGRFLAFGDIEQFLGGHLSGNTELMESTDSFKAAKFVVDEGKKARLKFLANTGNIRTSADALKRMNEIREEMKANRNSVWGAPVGKFLNLPLKKQLRDLNQLRLIYKDGAGFDEGFQKLYSAKGVMDLQYGSKTPQPTGAPIMAPTLNRNIVVPRIEYIFNGDVYGADEITGKVNSVFESVEPAPAN